MKLFNVFTNLLLALMLVNTAYASIPLAPRMGAGGKMDMFGCMQSNDYYIANFAAYQTDPKQPPKTMPMPLCLEIPKAGQTQITVDMLDRDVRQKPVTLKVFDSEKKLLQETPAKVAKQGYISINVDFPKAGYYDLGIYVTDQDLNIAPDKSALHIPLTVAVFVPAPAAPMSNILVIIASIGAFALGLGWLVPRLSKREQTA